MAGRIQLVRATGPYRIELDVLPAEPFVSSAAAASGTVKVGMVRLGGASPASPAVTNHHLVAHVFNRMTGRALTHANVRIQYKLSGSPVAPIAVPIVRMEAVGQGSQSTHYGNNVRMRPGTYDVAVMADDYSTTFHLTIPPPMMGNGAMTK
jgi:hypothetical protein